LRHSADLGKHPERFSSFFGTGTTHSVIEGLSVFLKNHFMDIADIGPGGIFLAYASTVRNGYRRKPGQNICLAV